MVRGKSDEVRDRGIRTTVVVLGWLRSCEDEGWGLNFFEFRFR